MSFSGIMVKFGIDQAQFKRGMTEVKAHTDKFARDIGGSWKMGLGGLAGGILGAIGYEGFRKFLDDANQLKDIAEQLDMSAAATQRWQKAAAELGVSFGRLQNLIMTVQQKREDAKTNANTRKELNALGISDAEIFDQQINGEDFFARVMRAGKGNRTAFGNAFGGKSVRMLAAASEFEQAEPDLNQNDLETAEKAEKVGRKIQAGINKMWSRTLAAINPYNWGEELDGLVESISPMAAERQKKRREEAARKAAAVAAVEPAPVKVEDPLLRAKQEKQQEAAEKQLEAERKLRDIKRQAMTDDQKRVSLTQEVAALTREIADLERISATGGLNEKGQERLMSLREQQARYQNEMTVTARNSRSIRERGETWGTQNIGLLSASSANAGLMDVQRRQLILQERIEANTRRMSRSIFT